MAASSNSDKKVVPNLHIHPEGLLEFDRDESVANLDLKNALHLNVMFKVKTTSPASFTVRPSQGILSAGAHVSVAVRLHEQVQSQGNRDWSKDKFKVSSSRCLSYKHNYIVIRSG